MGRYLTISTLLILAALTITPVFHTSYAMSENEGIRVLLVIGGLKFDVRFFSIFDDIDEMSIEVAQPEVAFGEDFSSNYDVLVMFYFNEAPPPETQQTNLRKFVESGKGLVLIHSTIASYITWTWWVEEVLGAAYFHRQTGDNPPSEYYPGVEIVALPTGTHPITDGLGPFPFHILDETYKKLWLSPRNKVLLKTSNPNSDGPISWISPCATSKVVVIQPGHGVGAFSHPAYMNLVRGAILWVSGR